MQTIPGLIQDKYVFGRRNFLKAGTAVVAASVANHLIPVPAAAQNNSFSNVDTTIPVKLSPLNHPSEAAEGPLPAPLEPSKRTGFAIVGLGKLSLEQLLPAFGACKYARPVALVSGDQSKAAKVAAQYGIDPKNIYNYQNFDSIKNNPAVEVVYIVLPNGMHEEFTIRSANAGKHILCEKPLANSSEEASRMVDAAKKANRLLMTAYRIQYEPHNRMMMDWVRNNKYGKAKLIEMYNGQNIGDPAQWRLNKKLAGSGALGDIGIYCLNTARFLTGEEPLWVNATMYSTPNDVRFKEVEESVMFQMQFPGGTLVNASCSYGAHQSRRYRVYADNGGHFGMDPAFSYFGLEADANEVRDEKDWKIKPAIREENQFALEMDHMAQCVMQNKKPYTPGEEGLQDMRIIEAIFRSATEKKVVQLTRHEGKDMFRGENPKKES